MQLKANHFYLTRDGNVIGPLMRYDNPSCWKFRDPIRGGTYTDEGHRFFVQKTAHDLVKELGSAADGWLPNTGKVPHLQGRVEAICSDGSLLTFPAGVTVYWEMSNLPSAILLYRPIKPAPEPKRKRVERLSHSLLIRMKEINATATSGHAIPTYHDYTLLWDAILDEIKHHCPDFDVERALK